ncbi:MAG: putative membrane protein [Candidatus Woesebacteria bacterium GW2011_GWB1_41_10]|uniref:Putative membrane protein n=1 Tax=Candidatus Woesebacteria bacterium GW2011_GWB1_41_10 TaxID=1618577 RepID=A0A0G0WQK6_9BACT|nr:MAG: putative membrane protein [Candidatus Woesebacteria bacterium GW2011_GWB1_41_10]
MIKYKKFAGLILALALSVVIFVYRDKFTNLQGYGYLGLFIISVLGNATIVLPTPVVLTAFLGGGILNPLWVSIVVSLGATIGELTGYVAGVSGKHLINEGGKIQKVKKWMEKYGLWTLFVLAAIPNPFFDLAGIVAGATGVKVYKYFIIVTLGKLIKFGSISFLGAGLL